MKSRHPSEAVTRAARNAIEPLEARVMLSVTDPFPPPVAAGTAALRNGTLIVVGTARGDWITFARDADAQLQKTTLDVTVNKSVFKFSIADVKVVRCYGFSGSDYIAIDQSRGILSFPGYYFGGLGNDTIIGGSGNDTLVGSSGNDLLEGMGGNDSLQGDIGNDRLLGGDGVDTLDGGLGRDTINTGAGKDKVINGGDDVVDTGDAGTVTSTKKARYIGGPIIQRRGARGRPADYNGAVTGYTPQQMRTAYGFGSLSDSAFTNRGAGQTIAIVDAYHYPTAMADLNYFSRTFGLPQVTNKTFQVFYASRVQPAVDVAWAGETALDVQWAHAIAPEAKIIVVEAETAMPVDLFNAIDKAEQYLQPTGGVVSLSLGINEAIAGQAWERWFRNSVTGNVSFVAAAGDTGGELSHPATSPEVLAVGGTFLPLDAAGNRNGDETAWLDGGGGTSAVFSRPAYQEGLIVEGNPIGDARVVPDVAYNADPMSGVAVYSTTPNLNGDTGWEAVGGTSAGAPQWAGIVAMANQQRLANHLPMLGGSTLQQYLYGLARKYYYRTFNDITVGSNTVHPATETFDQATGWGTPKATALIGLLGQATSRVAPVATDATLGFQWIADFTRPLYSSQPANAVTVFQGNGVLNISLSTASMTFRQFPTVDGDVLDLLAPNLQRIGNTLVGRGSATGLLADGTPGSWVVQFEGRLFRQNGVDRVTGQFYAISRRGKIIQQGLQSIVRGKFAFDKNEL